MSDDNGSIGRGWAEVGRELDDLKHLYTATITDARGEVVTDRGAFAIHWSGEIQLYGAGEAELPPVTRIRRVALYGQLDDPAQDPEIGEIGLAGPLGDVAIEPALGGRLQLQLHYAALTARLPPLRETEDAVTPQVEQLAARLTWAKGDLPGARGIPLEVALDLSQQIAPLLGIVQAVTLFPVVLDFLPAGAGGMMLLALNTGCAAPNTPCPGGTSTQLRRLPLRFIDFTQGILTADVESACNLQILRACEVWRNKAALTLDIQAPIVPGANWQRGDFNTPDLTQENSLPLPQAGAWLPGDAQPSASRIEIYVVNTLPPPRSGGGITHNVGKVGSFVILAYNSLAANPYLLAHEIGHVLGLDHPDVPGPDMASMSSPGSVMQAATPNAPFNTLYNCRIFSGYGGLVLNPIVASVGPLDCFRPDLVDHFVRDFPADNGAQPSMPPAGFDRWSNSNVWNRRANAPGGINAAGGPQHESPYNTDSQNFMFVRLEQRTTPADPVTVQLFITEPGSAPGALSLRPLATSNTLRFDRPTPLTGAPLTQALRWNPSSRPAGYPTHACVLALASSLDEPAPAAITFAALAGRLATDNDVAQRNVNFLKVASLQLRTLRVLLPWVQMVNPFAESGAALLTLDTRGAADLLGLALEIDGEGWPRQLEVGQEQELVVRDELPPEKPIVLRLAAALPPNAPLGLELTINLRFALGERLINGYQHVLRVSALAEAMEQVADGLVGTLRDIGFAFDAPEAGRLARSVARLVRRHRADPEGAFRALRRQAGRIAALAYAVEPSPEPEAPIVQRLLFELAGLLTGREREEPAAFIERLRELTDYIQEPAGRAARRRLRASDGELEPFPARFILRPARPWGPRQ